MQFDSTIPIWTQLVAEFTRRIAADEWAPGARIPGVRDLAADLGVNPNTAQRALAELERSGLCVTERTSGRFVTDDPARIDGARADLLQTAADDYIRRARGLGIAAEHAVRLIHERWTDHDHEHDNAGGVARTGDGT